MTDTTRKLNRILAGQLSFFEGKNKTSVAGKPL